MNSNKFWLIPLLLLTLIGCTENPYFHNKQITIESERCDKTGCRSTVRYKHGHNFEIDSEQIEWK